VRMGLEWEVFRGEEEWALQRLTSTPPDGGRMVGGEEWTRLDLDSCASEDIAA
jgi:hypothetical protein